MKDIHLAVDELYAILGIHGEENAPRNRINVGAMERKLNTDCSAIMGNKQRTAWSSSTKKTEKR